MCVSGSDERRPDGVRHRDIPTAQPSASRSGSEQRRNRGRHTTTDAAAAAAAAAATTTHRSVHAHGTTRYSRYEYIFHRRRIQPAHLRSHYDTLDIYILRCDRVLHLGKLGILRILLFRLHFHVHDRFRRFRTSGLCVTSFF